MKPYLKETAREIYLNITGEKPPSSYRIWKELKKKGQNYGRATIWRWVKENRGEWEGLRKQGGTEAPAYKEEKALESLENLEELYQRRRITEKAVLERLKGYSEWGSTEAIRLKALELQGKVIDMFAPDERLIKELENRGYKVSKA